MELAQITNMAFCYGRQHLFLEYGACVIPETYFDLFTTRSDLLNEYIHVFIDISWIKCF